ncbi:MAG: aldo/keto reductase [Chloroflexi bacterium]|nr:aldo/keto reductase [Chloroflexota bacterium]
MEYRDLGRTGVRVSALGFGCGSIGGLMVRGAGDEQRRAVERAIEAGITYFDTAASYGDGRSEETIGPLLREVGADVYLGTKFRLDPEDVADAPAQIRRHLEESLRRLGTERVDLFQLHNRIGVDVSGNQGALSVEDVVGPVADGLAAVRDAGLTRFIGITGLGETAAVTRVVESGRFDTVQCYVNALNPSAGWPVERAGSQNFDGLLSTAAAAGLGTIAIRVLAAGALTGTPPEARHQNAGDPGSALVSGGTYRSDLERARALRALSDELGVESPAALSYRLVLSLPGLSTALVGASDLSQLEDVLRWAEHGPLSPDAVQRVVGLAAG